MAIITLVSVGKPQKLTSTDLREENHKSHTKPKGEPRQSSTHQTHHFAIAIMKHVQVGFPMLPVKEKRCSVSVEYTSTLYSNEEVHTCTLYASVWKGSLIIISYINSIRAERK